MSNSLLHDATLELVNQSTKDFWSIIRADVSKRQSRVKELINARTSALMGTENPAVSRRLCRAVINMLTKDSVEVPRQQGSPELSEALERVINLLKSPNDTQWTQDEYQAVKSGLVPKETTADTHCGSRTSCTNLDSTCKCDCKLCDPSTERSPMVGHEQGYKPTKEIAGVDDGSTWR